VKRGWGAMVATLVAVAFITPALTSARFSARGSSLDSAFGVGSFSPSSAPTPWVSLEGSAIRLRWSPVEFSGSSIVEYRVRRTTVGGSTEEACATSAVPTLVNGEVTCLDSAVQPGISYTYAVQPVLVRNGIPTWSLQFGTESPSINLPGLLFAGAGPIVNVVASGLVAVPYPSGTELGDLLVIVVVNGRNKAPRRPSGWTDVVSRGIGGAQDFHLYTAQRTADGSTSVTVDVDTGEEGASMQVFRYDVPAGNPVPVVRASQVQSGFSTTATAQFVPTPDIITTSSATALSIVAVRADNPLSLVGESSWTLRAAATSTFGTTPVAWALADTTVGSAATVPSPTWQQAGVAARWVFGGSAFG
jgi:hypothetical protein